MKTGAAVRSSSRGDLLTDTQALLAESGIVDAHHHMLGDSQRRAINPGLWEWLNESYLWLAVISSGFVIPPGSVSVDVRMSRLMPYLRRTSATTYYAIAREGLFAVYGFDLDELTESNWRELDKLIRDLNGRSGATTQLATEHMNLVNGVLDVQVGGTLVDAMTTRATFDWYDYLARVRPHLDSGVVDAKTKVRQVDGYRSAQAIKIDTLLYGHLACCRREMKRLFGGSPEDIDTLDEYLGYVEDVIFGIARDPAKVALKSAIAGVRPLDFSPTEKPEASRVFSARPDALTPEEIADFENFIMHFICERAGYYELPVQIHTGAGPGGYNTDDRCRPSLLVQLIARNPATKFDLLHGGYPNWAESAGLACRFANVYLNTSWMTMVSDSQARLALDCWFDHVPSNKITWGGDCTYIEESVGAYRVALRQAVDVLERRVDDSRISCENALSCVRRFFRDNAIELYGIDTTVNEAKGRKL